MGLLQATEWKASWIEPGLPEDSSKPAPSPMLRRAFTVKAGITRARAYVTSHGLYELYMNGQRVGDQLFTPGLDQLQQAPGYKTYDVTSLLKPGDNVVGAGLGSGWYRGDVLVCARNDYRGSA